MCMDETMVGRIGGVRADGAVKRANAVSAALRLWALLSLTMRMGVAMFDAATLDVHVMSRHSI